MWDRMAKSIANFNSEEDFLNSYQNTFQVLEEAIKNKKDLPRFLFGCGEDDFLYKNFLEFKQKAEALKMDAEFFSLPGYQHEWRFWDAGIQKALDTSLWGKTISNA